MPKMILLVDSDASLRSQVAKALAARGFEVQENPITEEVGAGAQLAFGGTLPGVTTGATAPAAPPRAAPAATNSGNRRTASAALSSGKRSRSTFAIIPQSPPTIY